MTKEPIMIDDVDVSECGFYCSAEENNYNCMLLNNIKNDCSYYKLCYYKQLKRKEQECEELRNKLAKSFADERKKEIAIDQLKADNEKMEKGYIKLTEIVSPYIDDFTGYNEELRGFDIVLCVKELMKQLDALKEELENFKDDCKGCTTCIEAQNNERIYSQSSHKYKQALQEIKEIAEKDIHPFANGTVLRYASIEQILQKCEDVL